MDGFENSYLNYPNKHFNVSFSIIGDTCNRDIYVVAKAPTGGLECAALLDSSNMMLPVLLVERREVMMGLALGIVHSLGFVIHFLLMGDVFLC